MNVKDICLQKKNEEKKGKTSDMIFGNLSYHKMFSNRKRKKKYDMMSGIYVFQFSEKYFLC